MEFIFIGLLLAIFALLIYVFFIRAEKPVVKDDSLLLMQQQIQDLSRTLDSKLSESNKAMQEGSRLQFRESRELIQEINREMNEQLRNVVQKTTEVSESSKQVFAVADQLKELQSILKNPKKRASSGSTISRQCSKTCSRLKVSKCSMHLRTVRL